MPVTNGLGAKQCKEDRIQETEACSPSVWRDRIQETEACPPSVWRDRMQKAEDSLSGVALAKSERQRLEDGRPTTEDRGQKADDGGRKTKGRR